MLDLDKLKLKISDVPAIFPPEVKRSSIVPTKILCAEKDFAAFEIEGGHFGAIWDGHVDVVETKELLLEKLNKHELLMLQFEVNK